MARRILTDDGAFNAYVREQINLNFAELFASIGGGAAWGNITGTLSDQLDLQAALDAKLDVGVSPFDQDLNTDDDVEFNKVTIGNGVWFDNSGFIKIQLDPDNDLASIGLYDTALYLTLSSPNANGDGSLALEHSGNDVDAYVRGFNNAAESNVWFRIKGGTKVFEFEDDGGIFLGVSRANGINLGTDTFIQRGTAPFPSSGAVRLGDAAIDGETNGVWGAFAGDGDYPIIRLFEDSGVGSGKSVVIGGRSYPLFWDEDYTGLYPGDTGIYLGTPEHPWGSLYLEGSIDFETAGIINSAADLNLAPNGDLRINGTPGITNAAIVVDGVTLSFTKGILTGVA